MSEEKSKRPDWDEYFMAIAKQVASRATCDRRHVGAVLVSQDRVILSTGYNGAPRGMPHCDEIGHEIVEGHCVRTVHGEANAIAQAARSGVSIEKATLYTTASPCYDCFKLLINAGVKKVVYDEFYMSRYEASAKVLELAKNAGIEMRALKVEK
ncbi:dCMP deaminase family protein [Candidatus Berkelbacteria bacterium]|nr:dCMP deaminase family protein [Candidatus Berkelbacteria bacterium]MBI2588385.1 dCMP deaminase family protein [Candidatus Berkelbacteria bacterium]MBI4029670.1 dCMP deaminase family protein [Candidatus Berkelbacteria bacterium]